MTKDYSQYVEHPRFGKSPRFTGLDPDPNSPGVWLHPIARPEVRHLIQLRRRNEKPDDQEGIIPGTAIEADLQQQTPGMGAMSHYYDIDKKCRDCGKRFIFFAEEQKYWFEERKFNLNSERIRCWPCQQAKHSLAKKHQRYDQLLHQADRTTDENIEMAELCVTLIEKRMFTMQCGETVRMLLGLVPSECRNSREWMDIQTRLLACEKSE